MSAAMSAFAAPKVKRRPSSARRVPCPAPSPAALGVLLALGILVFSTASASAQSFFDPTSTIQAQATHWESQAAAWGRGIYLSLLVFELIALAVTTLLFRENLGEFFAAWV